MKLVLTLIIGAIVVFGLTACPNKIETSAGDGDASSKGTNESKPQPKRSDKGTGGNRDEYSKSAKTPSKEKEKMEDSKIKSVYTDLGENGCKTTQLNEEEEWSIQLCDGFGGYKLELAEGDIRQTINVITPNGKKHELNLWRVVSSAFSTVGKKAEWRIVKENGKSRPIALIVRFNASENPDKPEKITSYLSVSKITEVTACVTDVVKPIKNANVKARELADVAAGKPCKSG